MPWLIAMMNGKPNVNRKKQNLVDHAEEVVAVGAEEDQSHVGRIQGVLKLLSLIYAVKKNLR